METFSPSGKGLALSFDTFTSLCPVYGSALLSHSLIGGGFSENAKVGSGFDPENGMFRVCNTQFVLNLQNINN